MVVKKRIVNYAHLMRLNKPIGAFLLLWPTWWAIWLAGYPTPSVVMLFSFGALLMRSAGCVINDFADRNIDGLVSRTKMRPLASGRVTMKETKLLFLSLIFAAFLLVLLLNRLVILLSFFAAAMVVIYPFVKRFTYLPQLFLGLTYSCPIPMAYAASICSFPLTCWLLCIANTCWVVAYDTEYAMIDREDDLKAGIKSSAILFGRYDRLLIGLLQSITLVILVIVGLLNQLSTVFYLLLFIVLLLFLWQQRLIYKQKASDCFTAFLSNNYVGGLIWLAIITGLYF